MSSYESFPRYEKHLKRSQAHETAHPTRWAGWAVPYDWRPMRPPPVMHQGQITFPSFLPTKFNEKKTPLLQRSDTDMKSDPSILAKMSPAVWECIKDKRKPTNGSSAAKH